MINWFQIDCWFASVANLILAVAVVNEMFSIKTSINQYTHRNIVINLVLMEIIDE